MNFDYTQIYTDLKILLERVSLKVGEGAEYAWATVVKQQYTIGVSDLIWASLFIVVGITLATFAILCGKQANSHRHDVDTYFGGMIAFGLFAILSTVIGFGFLTSGVMHIINPDYYAIEFFVNLVKTSPHQ